MTRPLRFLALLAILLSAATAARADTPPGLETYPIEVVDRPLTLPSRVLEADVDFAFGLTNKNAFEPIVPTFGLQYGITDGLQLSADFALCLNGGAGAVYGDACPSAAQAGGISVTGSLFHTGVIDDAIFVGFNINSFSPTATTQLQAGDLFRLNLGGLLAVRLAPSINIGLNNRGGTNFDFINIPAALQIQLTKHFELSVNTGMSFLINAPVPTSTGDSIRIPFGVGVNYAISNRFDFGGNFTFNNLFGRSAPGNLQGFDYRTLDLYIALRM